MQRWMLSESESELTEDVVQIPENKQMRKIHIMGEKSCGWVSYGNTSKGADGSRNL